MNVILSGHGRMGRMIEELLLDAGDTILGVVDAGLFEAPLDVPGKADVLIDFSHPDNLAKALAFSAQTGCALVLGTTGYTDAQLSAIREAASHAPVIYASNYSLGVFLLKKAVEAVAPALLTAGFDVEVVEAHHNQKADAPSGTAKMLLHAIDPEVQRPRVYGRNGQVGARGQEIGVHAVRGGTVAGAHSVCFFGDDEVLTLTHSASSRRIFALGAIRAARFVAGRASGLYRMDDVLEGQ
ncbi:MAG: 4-hydroxy-tetrahydrodipicolinate reductase [Clostridia bacterium]